MKDSKENTCNTNVTVERKRTPTVRKTLWERPTKENSKSN